MIKQATPIRARKEKPFGLLTINFHTEKQASSEYRAIQKARRVWCEGSFGTMKRCHNLTYTYKKGIRNATEHCLLSALALNLKRMIKSV
jgi:hypothetical protein